MLHTISLPGATLSVADQGGGTPVVLVHGFPLNQTMWQAQLTTLSDAYRVLVPDLRGFGQSSCTTDLLTMENFADDLAGMLDELQISEPIVLGGLSMGGYVAFAFWRKYAARVKGLILCNTRAAADTPEAAAGRRATAAKVLQHGTAELVSGMSAKLLSSSNPRHEGLTATLITMMQTAPAATVSAALLGMAQRPDSRPLLASIDVPTLVISGQDDAIIPAAEMRDMSAALPASTYVELAEAGHMTPMEQPDQFNQTLLQFLQNLP